MERLQEHDVGKRILVVDDEPQIRRIMRAVLVAKGYEVMEAECGEEALKLISVEKYHYCPVKSRRESVG